MLRHSKKRQRIVPSQVRAALVVAPVWDEDFQKMGMNTYINITQQYRSCIYNTNVVEDEITFFLHHVYTCIKNDEDNVQCMSIETCIQQML